MLFVFVSSTSNSPRKKNIFQSQIFFLDLEKQNKEEGTSVFLRKSRVTPESIGKLQTKKEVLSKFCVN